MVSSQGHSCEASEPVCLACSSCLQEQGGGLCGPHEPSFYTCLPSGQFCTRVQSGPRKLSAPAGQEQHKLIPV